MHTASSSEHILGALEFLLEETFPGHPEPGNAFLDSGTGWAHTLDAVTHTQASSPLVPGGTTIAGHVEHTRFYLQMMREFLQGRTERVDWSRSWLVTDVTEERWLELREELHEEHRRVLELARQVTEWDEDTIATYFGLVAHSAYHLGAVRQMSKVVAER